MHQVYFSLKESVMMKIKDIVKEISQKDAVSEAQGTWLCSNFFKIFFQYRKKKKKFINIEI